MTPRRTFFAMLAVILLLIGLCGFVTYTGRKLIISEGDKLTELKLEQEVLAKRSTALAKANQDIEQYGDLEQIARSVVPQDKDQARTVLELVALARESDINITSVAFPDSLLGQISKGSKKASGTDPNLTQLTPLDNPKGVYSMEIRIGTNAETPIPYSRLLDFLKRLENNRRTAQVTNLSITPNEQNRGTVTFSLTLTSYVKP